MNNLVRHIACRLCRERKVRCDGGQPTCEKCRRSGETCVYVPTHKPTKADLAQTIESLQERLDKAEAYISRHGNTNEQDTNGQPPIMTPNSTMAGNFPDCSPFNLAMTSTVRGGDHFMSTGMQGMPSTPFSHHSLPLSPETMDDDFMNFIPSPNIRLHNDPSNFHMDNLSGGSTSTSSFQRENLYSHRHMPSLQEVRTINGSSSTSSTSPPSSPTRTSHRLDDANHILAELTAFGMVVFHTQAEIAGISSVVAEYLEWMRKAANWSGSGSGSGSETPKANPAVLEALETRMRELNAMAGSRHVEAWRQSVNRLERIPGVGAMLNLFDGEMQRRSNEKANFFQTSYDICQPLPEQLMRKD